jgi:hypothetical protein
LNYRFGAAGTFDGAVVGDVLEAQPDGCAASAAVEVQEFGHAVPWSG